MHNLLHAAGVFLAKYQWVTMPSEVALMAYADKRVGRRCRDADLQRQLHRKMPINGSFPFRLQPKLYCFRSGGIAPGSGKDCVSVAGVVPLSSDPVQWPAHSLVPLTVPTSLQPIGSFGFT